MRNEHSVNVTKERKDDMISDIKNFFTRAGFGMVLAQKCTLMDAFGRANDSGMG
ncbi:MAG: hypothetical protein Q7V05_09830 [Methanoregula sp.]|nr:hypothetical protein [Methanoregula sp.]